MAYYGNFIACPSAWRYSSTNLSCSSAFWGDALMVEREVPPKTVDEVTLRPFPEAETLPIELRPSILCWPSWAKPCRCGRQGPPVSFECLVLAEALGLWLLMPSEMNSMRCTLALNRYGLPRRRDTCHSLVRPLRRSSILIPWLPSTRLREHGPQSQRAAWCSSGGYWSSRTMSA